MSKPFKPAWWLANPHLQTLWSTFFRRRKNLLLQRERIELPDGDFIDLDWAKNDSGPIILILHGLEGSSQSPYAQGMLHEFLKHGWRGAVMHFRSCSGEMNRLPRSYHSGETQDLAYVIEYIKKREPGIAMGVIGFSLGGNVLLKWLGETGYANTLAAAVAVSVPFELHKSAQRLRKGFSRVYEWHLLKSLSRKMMKKAWAMEIEQLKLPQYFHSIEDFDDKVTAPLHGFHDAQDYYQRSSSRYYMHNIQIPTLILQAEDDPFMTPDVIPKTQELSSAVRLEVCGKGGHVGFIAGNLPGLAQYWLDYRIPLFLKDFIS
jgi:uncharacterized protein